MSAAATLLLVAATTFMMPPAGSDGGEFRNAAVTLGKDIDAARTTGMTEADLDLWAARILELRRRAVATREGLEAAAGEDEAALERLFRSPAWTGYGFTVAAARYWQSWLDLDRYRRSGNTAELEAARHGFQSTIVLIVYPGLVRGSWLGLGYVEDAAGNREAARSWFDRVAAGGGPLADIAARELDLLAALEYPAVQPGPALETGEADSLEREALALLARHGETLDGARAAAERLRALEAAGEMTADRVRRLLQYRDQIIGHDIGPAAFLVSAEDALHHQQFYTAVQKYRSFFAALDTARAREFVDFRPRFADALIGSGLPESALSALDDPAVAMVSDQARVLSLRHLASALIYVSRGSETAREAYREAALAAPDAAAHFSREILAGAIANAGEVARSARRSSEPWMQRLPAFELAYREFRYAAGASARQALAVLGLDLLDWYDRETRAQPWLRVAAAELEGEVDEDVAGAVERLAELQGELAGADPSVTAALFGARVRLLRYRIPGQLPAFLQTLAPPLDDLSAAHLLDNLASCRSEPWCFPVTDRLIVLFAGDREKTLLLSLQRTRMLLDAGRDDEAYQSTLQLVGRHPLSGDAWQLHAQACARVGRRGDADHAWARIAAGAAVGSRAWRDAQLARFTLRLEADNLAAACQIRADTRSDASISATLDARLRELGKSCTGSSANAGAPSPPQG